MNGYEHHKYCTIIIPSIIEALLNTWSDRGSTGILGRGSTPLLSRSYIRIVIRLAFINKFTTLLYYWTTCNKRTNTAVIIQKHTLIMSATLTYPPGGTFFDTIKLSFADVPVDRSSGNAIPTTEFLEAAESLTSLFGTTRCLWLSRAVTNHVQTDVLGSVAFTPVKSDMTGNIKVDPPPQIHQCVLS